MNKILVIVDMQNDFVYGSLGTPEAQSIVPRIVNKLNNNVYDLIAWTQDCHYNDYLNTLEGRCLPVEHCMRNTEGQDIVSELKMTKRHSLFENIFEKETYGSLALADFLAEHISPGDTVEFIGVCTDICVISNVLLARAAIPENQIIVDSSCCAGTTPMKHAAALEVMKSCNVEVI